MRPAFASPLYPQERSFIAARYVSLGIRVSLGIAVFTNKEAPALYVAGASPSAQIGAQTNIPTVYC